MVSIITAGLIYHSFRAPNTLYTLLKVCVPGRVAQLVGASSHTPKVVGSISDQGRHKPKLRAPLCLGRIQETINLSLFLSHLYFYISIFLSLKSITISSGEDLKNYL